jgi:hypothetical protein
MDRQLLKDVNRLCSIICNSSPDTAIRGEIESLAFSIGHHPLILGAENARADLQYDDNLSALLWKRE